MSSQAAEAAMGLAHRLRIPCAEPLILRASRRISIRLFPLDIVAKAASLDDREAVKRLTRELEIARHLAKNNAPVVRPSTEPPGGPHIQQGFVLALWEFVEHVAAEDDNAEHVARAAEALHRVHQALAGCPVGLPDLWIKLDHCRTLLENKAALPALHAADRTFLLTACDQLRARVTSLPTNAVPIHGDAHLGNVFVTPDDVRWNDLEDVSMGPREWDIGWLSEANLRAFEPVNPDLLAACHYLRSLCASVWCWEQYDIPEKREAADYHLAYLREAGLFQH